MLRNRPAFCDILMKNFKTWILNYVQRMWFDVLPIGKSVEKRYCRKSTPRDDQTVTSVKGSVCIL